MWSLKLRQNWWNCITMYKVVQCSEAGVKIKTPKGPKVPHPCKFIVWNCRFLKNVKDFDSKLIQRYNSGKIANLEFETHKNVHKSVFLATEQVGNVEYVEWYHNCEVWNHVPPRSVVRKRYCRMCILCTGKIKLFIWKVAKYVKLAKVAKGCKVC